MMIQITKIDILRWQLLAVGCREQQQQNSRGRTQGSKGRWKNKTLNQNKIALELKSKLTVVVVQKAPSILEKIKH